MEWVQASEGNHGRSDQVNLYEDVEPGLSTTLFLDVTPFYISCVMWVPSGVLLHTAPAW